MWPSSLYPCPSAIPLARSSQRRGAPYPPRAQAPKNFCADANFQQRLCTSQCCGDLSANAPQSGTPMLTGQSKDSQEVRDGHHGTAKATASKRAGGDCGESRELQGDAGKVRTRARRVFRPPLAKPLRRGAAAGLGITQTKSPERGLRAFVVTDNVRYQWR